MMPKTRNSSATTDTDTSGSERSVASQPDLSASSCGAPVDTIERMRGAVLDAAAHSIDSVRREALHAYRDPRRRLRHVRRLELPDAPRNVALYQCQKARTGTTRVLGLSHVYAPIHEVVAVLSHKSALSTPLLNPGLATTTTLATLVDKATQLVAVQSLTMHDQWLAPLVTRAREFVVMESQQAFETDDGRRGWIVTFHSLAWPGCPEPPRHAVRASVYNTGVVALERRRHAEIIDLYSVAEFKLKGQSRGRADWTAAKDRVLETLARLSNTVEQHTGPALDETLVLETSAFHAIARETDVGGCSLCRDPPPHESFRCRKCCVSVCGRCSSTWQRADKQVRLCHDCWGEATLEF